METVIVFDMDGVLAEVTESYRQAIVETVDHFTGQRIARELIQDYKNQGGWNNDWSLSQKIAADLGVKIPYDTIVEQFNKFFLGEKGDGEGGLIQRETWFPEAGLLERLSERYALSLFTGRLKYEADITLRRFAPSITFDPMVCAEHVTEVQTRSGWAAGYSTRAARIAALVCRRYGGRCPLGSRRGCSVHWDCFRRPFPP